MQARPSWAGLLCLGVVLSCCAVGVVGAEGLQLAGASRVQQQNGRFGFIVPLSVRHGVLEAQGRRLLKHGAIAPVLGAVREGYFYAQLLLGTPPTAYSTIIDTGSSITYIPCSKCEHCGTHMATPFNPDKSSTARWLTCTDKHCQCGNPACGCKQDTCYYTRHYAEESSSEGWMVADKLHLAAAGSDDSSISSNSSRAVEVVFGCENLETGEIYKQKVDGVLGMGNNANALPRQLARAGVTENMFSLCYGFPEGGSMLLGDVGVTPEPKMAYTPLVYTPHNYYTIATQSISLGGKRLVINQADFGRGYGTVLDSGTTFTYLPTSAYKAFFTALMAAIQPANLKRASGKDPTYNDVCWVGVPKEWDDVSKIFPRGRMTFSGGAHIDLVPYRYLFKVADQQFCLGVFDNGFQGTLLGGIITRNVLVQYDNDKKRAGFADMDCNAIKAVAQPREINESSGDDSDKPQQGDSLKPAGEEPASKGDQQEAAGAAGSAHSSKDAKSSRPQEKAAAAAPDPGDSNAAAGAWHASFGNRKSLWLGLAVGGLLAVALVQLACATLWQPPPGGSKGGSSGGGGLFSGARGGNSMPYQAVGTADDQELVELSERGLLGVPHAGDANSQSNSIRSPQPQASAVG